MRWIDRPIDVVTLRKIIADTNMSTFGQKVSPQGECADLSYLLTTQLTVPLSIIAKFMLFDKWKDQVLYTITRECGETKEQHLATGHYKYTVKLSNVSVGKMFEVLEEMVRLLFLDS